MRTKEKRNALGNEVETTNKKLAELNEEELMQISGGTEPIEQFDINKLLSGGGAPGTDPVIEFEDALDKETFPGTDYTVIREHREGPIN